MCIITHGLDRVNINVYLCVVYGFLCISLVSAGTSTWGIFSRTRKKRDARSRRGYSPWSLRDWPQAATFQATTCRAHGGCLTATPAAKASPEDWPGLRPAIPSRTVTPLAYCAFTHAAPRAACCAIAHACGWACAITHVLLWMGLCYHPQAYCAITHNRQKKTLKNQMLRPLFPARNARARFFNF